MVWPFPFNLSARVIHLYLQKNTAGDQGKQGGGGGGGRKKRDYVPQKRSGGYAVLLSLYIESQVGELKCFHMWHFGISSDPTFSLCLQIPGAKGYMFKIELQTEAQQFCDKSFTVVSEIPVITALYTFWSGSLCILLCWRFISKWLL